MNAEKVQAGAGARRRGKVAHAACWALMRHPTGKTDRLSGKPTSRGAISTIGSARRGKCNDWVRYTVINIASSWRSANGNST